MEWYRQEISKCTYRQITTGFFFQKPGSDAQIYDNNVYVKDYIYLGTVQGIREDGACEMEQRNKFCVGDKVEAMKPNGDNLTLTVVGISDEEGNAMESCPHPQQKIFVTFDQQLEAYDIIRCKNEDLPKANAQEEKKEDKGGCSGNCCS